MATWLGIDVGGTKVALRAEGDRPGETSFRWQRDASAAEDLAALAAGVRSLGDRFDGVGVAMPATLDADGLVITWPSRPSWTGFALGDALAELFGGAAVRCADDGDLAALAEAEHAGCADVVYVGVGTGIGGGIMLDGRLVPGLGRGSCEIGHLVVDRNGPVCGCGRRGCLQAIASGPATLRRANTSFDALRDAWLSRADRTLSIVDESAAAIAAAVVSLAELVHPRLAIIGGGFADALPGFAELVADHTHTLTRPGQPPVPVHPAALGALSSLRGALLLARESGGC